MHDQDVRTLRHQHDWVVAGEWIVAGVLLQHGSEHEAARARIEQCVAIGLGLRRFFRAERVAGAGAIVDNHGLAKGEIEIIADKPGDHIDRTAGRRGNDDLDRPRGIKLRGCWRNVAEPKAQRGSGGQ